MMEGIRLIIIGAGPAGCATACLAANKGANVTVFEGKQDCEAPTSHMLGLNQRGQNTLKSIRPDFVEEMDYEPVSAISVLSNQNKVMGQAKSGYNIATNRDEVNVRLFEEARKKNNVTFKFGHKLNDINMKTKELSFTKTTSDGDEEQVTIKVQDDEYLVACDGAWSKTRTCVFQDKQDLAPRVEDWGFKIRVLYTDPKIEPDLSLVEGLQGTENLVFPSARIYAGRVKGRWLMGCTIPPTGENAFFGATEATQENINALRSHLAINAPPFSNGCVTDEELQAFFKRRVFGGCIVCPKTLQADGWVVFLGDAAHSVLPLTGEGVNSSLEDALKFVTSLEDSLAAKSRTPLEDYNTSRLPDILALADYAKCLRDAGASPDPAFRAANLFTRVFITAGKKIGVVDYTVDDYTIGEKAPELVPYRDLFSKWRKQHNAVFPPLFSVFRFFNWCTCNSPKTPPASA